MHKDSNLSRRRWMPKMLKDRPGNMGCLHRSAGDDLALGPELATRWFCLPWQQTSVIRKRIVCRTGTLL
jgi:hypothetical protein